MKTLSLQLPETVFSALRLAPEACLQAMRLVAAVKWYELEQISQGKAAEVARVTRADFIEALSQYQVSVWQYTAEE